MDGYKYRSVISEPKHILKVKMMVCLLWLGATAAAAVAPVEYNQGLCIVFLGLFLMAFLFFLLSEKLENYFNFTVIFSITYLFVYFVYPVFVYPYDKDRFFSFAFGFDENIITKATGLALIGYISFILGVMHKDGKGVWNLHFINSKKRYGKKDTRFVTLTVIIVTILDIIRIIRNGQLILTSDQGGLWGYFLYIKLCIFAVAITMQFCCIKKEYIKIVYIFKKNTVLWSVILIDILLCFATGRRTDPLFVSLMILAGIFLHKKSFSLWKMLFIVITGIVFLNFIMINRMGGGAGFSINILNLAEDLILNNYTLYVAYEYVHANGLVPFTLLGSLLRIVPFLLGKTAGLFHIPYSHVYSASFFTVLILKEKAGLLGLGTNIIASLYLGAGLSGVIIGMYFYGRFVRICSVKPDENNPYKILMYFMMMGVSVYNVRSEYFYVAGFMAVSVVLMYLFRNTRM